MFRFIQAREVVSIIDLMNELGYGYEGVRNRLYRLEKQKLVEKLAFRAGAYCLTNEACRSLE